jgi:hypothetical protein
MVPFIVFLIGLFWLTYFKHNKYTYIGAYAVTVIGLLYTIQYFGMQENMTSGEAIQNIASLYNSENMTVKNLTVTGHTNLNTLKVDGAAGITGAVITGSDLTSQGNIKSGGKVSAQDLDINAQIWTDRGAGKIIVHNTLQTDAGINAAGNVMSAGKIIGDVYFSACGSYLHWEDINGNGCGGKWGTVVRPYYDPVNGKQGWDASSPGANHDLSGVMYMAKSCNSSGGNCW